jgi:vitamin B12 transporter
LKIIFSYFILLFFTYIPIVCLAQKHDTLASVTVISKKEKNIIASAIPVQQLNSEQLQKINSISVADAVKQFAGVQVKDYGGIGGLKTVSVRSLGANHTAVLYDGIAIADAQGGQIDLGKFSLDNIDNIQLYNSNSTEILLPARAFASASLFTLKSSSSILNRAEKQNLKIKLQQGSFGYFSPSLLFTTRIGQSFQTSVSAMYQTATSDYPFISYENRALTEKRKNSDINAYRIEYDAAYFKNDSNKIKFKTYYYNSKRGLPGSIILYNNSSSQRLNDENFFVQATWQNKFNSKNEFLLSTKFFADKNYYLDPSYPNSFGKLENEFRQKEIYVSGAYKYAIAKFVEFSYATDFFNSALKRTDIFADSFANPNRITFLNNVAIQIKKDAFEINGNLLHTNISEKVQNGKTGKELKAFTPSISTTIKPFNNKTIYLRAFYKHIFRAPTFNDLYFTNIGNVNLKPEVADQYNIGITFSTNNISFLDKITITTDAYINNVSDKILAVPRQNLFQWSMQNIGSVKIKGLDATLHLLFNDWRGIKLSSNISYTFQQALDISDATSSLYKTQLPYTPMHTGSVSMSAQYKKAVLSYNLLASSYRYRQGDAIAENILQGWSSHDISLAYTLKENYKIIAEANNIFNNQYEIIRYYPMPRFNYRISFIVHFKKQKKT